MMGGAKVEKIKDANGIERSSRIPQKPLNLYMKATLLSLLKRNDIKIEQNARFGSNTMTVKDSANKVLMTYENAWDYGWYSISVPNPAPGSQPIIVAEMDWFENDNYTNPQQQDIFDIFDALVKKEKELKQVDNARGTLTPEEMLALQTLGMQK